MTHSRHWELSCRLNACLGGAPDEPLCSRVYRQRASRARRIYLQLMDHIFHETNHCHRIHKEYITQWATEPFAFSDCGNRPPTIFSI